MEFWTDPLKDDDKEIEVYDLASANHVGKIANELFFSIFYMEQNMSKELARMGDENFHRKVALLEPYLTSSDTSTSASDGGASMQEITSIPNPLPSNIPSSVKQAIEYLDEQYGIEEKRMNAELSEDTEQLRETLARMQSKLKTWFTKEVRSGAKWLAKKKSVVLAGTLMIYKSGDITFSYTEINYDDYGGDDDD